MHAIAFKRSSFVDKRDPYAATACSVLDLGILTISFVFLDSVEQHAQ